MLACVRNYLTSSSPLRLRMPGVPEAFPGDLAKDLVGEAGVLASLRPAATSFVPISVSGRWASVLAGVLAGVWSIRLTGSMGFAVGL